MSDIHIDDFHKDCAKILVQLYRQFPRKTILFVEDFAGADTPDEYGLHSERHQAGFAAAVWLAETGYIQYLSPIRQEALDQAVLTHKAFTLLSSRANFLVADMGADNDTTTSNYTSNYTGNNISNINNNADTDLPSSVLERTQTNIHQLRQALRSNSSIVIGQLVQQLLLQARHFS